MEQDLLATDPAHPFVCEFCGFRSDLMLYIKSQQCPKCHKMSTKWKNEAEADRKKRDKNDAAEVALGVAIVIIIFIIASAH